MDDAPTGSTSRPPELRDLERLCRELNRAGASYLVIGGFAVILHGYARATKDIDLLIDTSPVNMERVREAMAYLEDNAAAEIRDDDLEHYAVVRVADEILVDLMRAACGIDYAQAVASEDVETFDIAGVSVPVAGKRLLIRTKDTVRPSDAADVAFLRLQLGETE